MKEKRVWVQFDSIPRALSLCKRLALGYNKNTHPAWCVREKKV